MFFNFTEEKEMIKIRYVLTFALKHLNQKVMQRLVSINIIVHSNKFEFHLNEILRTRISSAAS